MYPTNYVVPIAVNEPVLDYAPGSKERDAIVKALHDAVENR
jgi:hypothetical protein